MSERQYGALEVIRVDHKARYHFAVNHLNENDIVLDAACGCGYGSFILSGKANHVFSIDNSKEAIQYAKKHYYAHNISYLQQEMPVDPEYILTPVDTTICFETIEHVLDPLTMLKQFRNISEKLICSVPNEEKMPFSQERFPFHHRHYTKQEFNELLVAAGWRAIEWLGQEDAFSRVQPKVNGRTLVAVCV